MTTRHDADGVYGVLADLDAPCYIVRAQGSIGASPEPPAAGGTLLAVAGPMPTKRLGDPGFLRHHGVHHPYMAGAMAAGIASEALVTALARAGYLASFGAAGLSPERVERALLHLAREIPGLPYAVNLIHTPHAPHLERRLVDLYLKHRLRCVEASAFVQLTPDIVRYRVAGLRPDPVRGVNAENCLIAKVSRPEVAELFLRPPPAALVAALLARGLVTEEQAALAGRVPMADDLTVEGDSAGHTDRRPLITALPAILRLRDRIAQEAGYSMPVRVGAAGGIGTPQAACAAFVLGAAYVVTGSVNQCCVESGTSTAAKALLAAAGPADYAMAPAADMFETGAEVQVLRRQGGLFAGRARRLFELYRAHGSLDDLSAVDRRRLEGQFFHQPLTDIWQETAAYLAQHHPAQLSRADVDPKHRMALLFRWYLGQSSRWATSGDPDRLSDYQIWCGPAMGAFNDWVRGSVLESLDRRQAADVAHHLLRGAAFQHRVTQLRFSGVRIPQSCSRYRLPMAPSPAPTGP